MRPFALGTIVLFVCALIAPSPVAAAGKNQVLPNGVVKTVSATSLTVTADGKDVTFGVDGKTRIVGKGVGTKSKEKRGKPTVVDLLKDGDRVTVTYQQAGSAMHATLIELAAR